VDRLTRKGLKTDRFAAEVSHTVSFLSEHRQQAVRYGIAGAVVLAVILGVFFYSKYQKVARREALEAAVRVQQAPIGPALTGEGVSFATLAERDKAAMKAFTELASRHGSSEEAAVSRYYLGAIAADQGRLADAEKIFREVSDSGQAAYGSLAKVALAEIYAGQGKLAEAEKVLRAVMEQPTLFVSREQAAIELARLLAPAKPAEARKLLEPLRADKRSVVSRAALTQLATLPSR